MQELLRTGAFARLCRTTKETLRHYERIGLLIPAQRADNGYKLYSYSQFADFLLIAALRDAGTPLEEVRRFMQDPNRADLQDVLEQRIAALERQRRELARKQAFLENTLARDAELAAWMAESTTPEGYRWRVRECAEEYLIDTPAAYVEVAEDDFIAAVDDHLAYCEEHGIGEQIQACYRVAAACAETGAYGDGLSVGARVAAPVDSPRLHVKPAGTYLQWLNPIDMALVAAGAQASNPMFRAYDALRAFARGRGWRLVGDLYDAELSLFAGKGSEVIYTEVSARIESRSAGAAETAGTAGAAGVS